ncbi:MAG: DUF1049 domain-containing protein [Leptolyngbya sp. SIO1E4]|nr:DUF1049 domain-containing protein [Leptolyngbya sp. SIO1E4]
MGSIELPLTIMRLFVISALVIAFLAILFALQNTNLVTIQFFGWEYQQSLALVLLSTLAIGVVVGLLVSFPAILRRSRRVTRTQKQADTLTELVQEKEQAVSAESQKIERVKQSYGELLQSLALLDPVTGLLRKELLSQTIATQMQHLKTPDTTAQGRSLSVLMFQVQFDQSLDKLTENRPEAVFAAVARRLQQRASVNTWFYSDGKGLFVTTTPGLDLKATTRYGEDLQAAVLEHLPTLPTGEALNADVSVGGAIAEHQTSTDAHQLVATAEAALEQALQRGRNRVRILPAV